MTSFMDNPHKTELSAEAWFQRAMENNVMSERELAESLLDMLRADLASGVRHPVWDTSPLREDEEAAIRKRIAYLEAKL